MSNKQTPSSQTRLKNLSLAAIAGQAGCVTLLIVIAALFIGLWLDAQLGWRGPCTVGVLALSVPFSLYAMVKLTLVSLGRLQPPRSGLPSSEED
jgi:MFS family permease